MNDDQFDPDATEVTPDRLDPVIDPEAPADAPDIDPEAPADALGAIDDDDEQVPPAGADGGDR